MVEQGGREVALFFGMGCYYAFDQTLRNHGHDDDEDAAGDDDE